jgi:hypothetical protein
MSQPNNRIGDNFFGDGDESKFAQKGRATEVRNRLKTIGSKYRKLQIETAILLVECRDRGYCVDGYSTFANYVESEVGITLRTAQELMRVIRKCQDADVSVEKIAELGWSKIALIASDMTKENAVELLAEVKDKTYSQLQESKRQKKKEKETKKNSVEGMPGSTIKPEGQPGIVLSNNILRAIQCASTHTRQVSMQANLEFMASAFMDLCPPPPRVPENPNWN